MKYVMEQKKSAGNDLNHRSLPCDESGRVIESTVCQISACRIKTRIFVPR